MSMQAGARKGLAAEMNVTPLIDVLLVLLIIFMVILPEHSLGEQALAPQPDTDPQILRPEAPVVIQLRDHGEGERPTLEINRRQIKWEELEAALQAIYSARQERTAFVQGDPEVEFAFVAEAIDVSHSAGAERVGLIGEK